MLPDCDRAIALAQTGALRPLTLKERLSLRYHRRLCLFCGCARGRFERVETARLRAEVVRHRKSERES